MSTLQTTPPDADLVQLRDRAGAIAASHRAIWQRKPVLREVYRDVYRRIIAQMSTVPGPAIELGGGPGLTKQFIPEIISSDVTDSPWLDFTGDAHALPLANGSLANLVLIDVLHHLARPTAFFTEVSRTLKPGGRAIIVDMYLSAMSWPVLRFLHPEPASLSIRPMHHCEDQPLFDDHDPWCSDQGMARAIFWKQRDAFVERFPDLEIVHRARFSTILWPLSGGFDHKDRVPGWAVPMLRVIDRWLEKAAALTAFRSLIVIEKRDSSIC